MNEAGYIEAIRKRLPPEIYAWKIHDRFTAGIPDLYLATDGGKSLWIEFKYLPTAPVRAIKPKLSPAQIRWLNSQQARGHNVLVIVGSPAGATIFARYLWDCAGTAPTNLEYDAVIQSILGALQ